MCDLCVQVACDLCGQVTCDLCGQVTCDLCGQVTCDLCGQVTCDLCGQVTPEYRGSYRCQPYNLYGTGGQSGEMRVEVRERPRFVLRPRNLYQRRLQDSVQMPCVVAGVPTPEVTWRRVSCRGGRATFRRSYRREPHD